MKLWLDAQLSPEMAVWVTQHFGIETIAVRDAGLRSAKDKGIFNAAKQADIVLITKDSDFSDRVLPQLDSCGRTGSHQHGPILIG